MTEQLFNKIVKKLSDYKYTSMKYTDFDNVSGYDLIFDNKKMILLYGYNAEIKLYEYNWAAYTAEDLLEAIGTPKETILITFIPPEWVSAFENNGFVVNAKWNDYTMKSLDEINQTGEPEFLTEADCEEASAVTLSCRGQSRGFSGQTTGWFKQWINGEEASAVNTGTRNNAVIIHRTDNGEITGIVCTATYAHNSEKGAIVWIREVAVKPEYQRRGIARKLIRQALYYGKQHGAKRAFLAADECNVHAIHLYESIGFKANKDEVQIDMIKNIM